MGGFIRGYLENYKGIFKVVDVKNGFEFMKVID